MLEAPSTEIAKRFSRYRQAAQRETVGVTHYSRITELLISKRDYDEYVRLKGLATRALRVEDLSGEAVAALEEAEMDPRHAHLDALMDDQAGMAIGRGDDSGRSPPLSTVDAVALQAESRR